MKVLAYSNLISDRQVEKKIPFRSLNTTARHLTVSVKLTGASVDVDAEIVTVPAFDPVV